MAIIEIVEDMTATGLLKFMNDHAGYLPGSVSFEAARSAIQVRTIESLVNQSINSENPTMNLPGQSKTGQKY